MLSSDVATLPSSFEADRSDDRLLPKQHIGTSSIGSKSNTHRCSLYSYLIGIAVLAVFFLAATNATLLWKEWQANQRCSNVLSIPRGDILDCGHSPEEARELDCVFDVMDYSWTPRPCFKANESHHYRDKAVSLGLTFWKDAERTQILPNDEIFAAKHEYAFSSRIFHTKHCEYYLDRQTHGLLDGLGTSLMRNSTYALHCLREVTTPGDPDERMFTGFHYEKCALGLGYLSPSRKRQPKGDLRHFVDGGAGNSLPP